MPVTHRIARNAFSRAAAVVACAFAAAIAAPASAADQAKGSIALGKYGATISHVVLVRAGRNGSEPHDPAVVSVAR